MKNKFIAHKLDLEGPLLIKSLVHKDSRGFFSELYAESDFKSLGLPIFIQDNFSSSEFGVLRGLHWQIDPGQGKLLRVLRGRIQDILLDIRMDSITYGKYLNLEIAADDFSWLWIPQGFAHGFLVLSPEGADVFYKVDTPYRPALERCLYYADPLLSLPWALKPGQRPIVSDRDQAGERWNKQIAQVTETSLWTP